MNKEFLTALERELNKLSKQLGSNVRPGHIDYISKHDAAEWATNLANSVRYELGRKEVTP